MKKKTTKKRTNKFFSPDRIATEIHQALERDFADAQHEYCISDYPAIAFKRQVADFQKKYCCEDQDKEQLEFETLTNFEHVNEHIGRVNEKLRLKFAGFPTRFQDCPTRSDIVHLRAKAMVRFVLGPFSSREWFEGCRNSSGSTIGVPYSDTSQESKFTFPVTLTRRAEHLYEECMFVDHRLANAVRNWNAIYPFEGYAQIVEGSRATTVDKTSTKRRFIAVEPTGNMYLQQGLMDYMYARLKEVGLDVEELPECHKQLARASSISGENATIDWSSASDCVSIELLRWLLPAEWFDAVWSVRCDYTSCYGVTVPLNMISSMGNATTFPLETLVFWAYAMATVRTYGSSTSFFPSWKEFQTCSVFGDDCIIPTPYAEKFISIMEEVGFIVNSEKSFYGTERFRESCGGDYLAGYDVRPYNIKAPPNRAASGLEPWLYIILNSLVTKYRTYFGELAYVYDRAVFHKLFQLFRENNKLVKLVPEYLPDDAGFKASDDVLRFLACYDITLDKIAVKSNGEAMFRYCRFVYWQEKRWYEELRYALKLKEIADRETHRLDHLGKVPRKLIHTSPIRKRGGYVVADRKSVV